MQQLSFQEKINALYIGIEKKLELIDESVPAFYNGEMKYTLFLSASSGKERARVVNVTMNEFEKAWERAVRELKKLLLQTKTKAEWIKVDLVTNILKDYDNDDFLKYVSGIKKNYFREGITFDKNFNMAFLEQEVNANVFFHNVQEQDATFATQNINDYLKNSKNVKKKFQENQKRSIYTFKTESVFIDEDGVHEVQKGWLNNGCRKVEEIDSSFIYDIVDKSSKFLAEQVYENGYFRYGYFPAFNKEINTYNILRHASTTYSMVEAYEFTKDDNLLEAIERSLTYLVKEAIKTIEVNGEECAFVIEEVADNEIKLGANAHALLAMSKYTKVCESKKYLDVMNALAKGIVYFQNQENGSFVHVLNYPDLSIKDKFRTIYYDGEAAFALMRYYEVSKNEKWLDVVEKAFEYFVEQNYWKHGDHWVSYASNEIFRYKPERKYAELNLKNAERKLDFCLTRETAFPTLLELLMASYNMINFMEENNLFPDLIEDFDTNKLKQAITHRSSHQLNSYFWPESAMYFKVPNNILNSFYIRHHSFRVRIDDIEHNISGYCSLLKVLGE